MVKSVVGSGCPLRVNVPEGDFRWLNIRLVPLYLPVGRAPVGIKVDYRSPAGEWVVVAFATPLGEVFGWASGTPAGIPEGLDDLGLPEGWQPQGD
jgi:hypothetical protein